MGARVLLYSHDTFGLGHLRRNLRIARALACKGVADRLLLVTGSPYAEAFARPAGCEVVALEGVTKTSDGRYRTRDGHGPVEEVIRRRSAVLVAAVESFAPDVVLVDHAPVGVLGELRPLLEWVRAAPDPPALVLGLRDIIDAAGAVRHEWDRLGVWPLLHAYDRVLVYGDRGLPTSAVELGLPQLLGARLRHVGYLADPQPVPVTHDTPTVVVTVGGGGDGGAVLSTYAEVLASWPGTTPFRSVVVAGPFLEDRTGVDLLQSLPHPVEVRSFCGGVDRLVAGAAGVVCMAGYNTVVEVLSAGVPALLLPRYHPRREQAVRAVRLRHQADLEVCVPGDPAPGCIDAFLRRVVQGGRRRLVTVRLDGLAQVAAEIAAVAQRGPARGGVGDLLVPA